MYSVPFSNENLYLPPAHLKALRLNTHIVVGDSSKILATKTKLNACFVF